MRSILVVNTAATDLSLLTQAERRSAAGLDANDASKDADLLAMDLRNAATICAECNIRVAGGKTPTLRQETLIETFRIVRGDAIILSRRHDVVISAFDSDGTALTDTDYDLDPESGILNYLVDDCLRPWCASKITITYQAGFAAVPDDLKAAALDYFKLTWLNKGRDPSVKSEEILIQDIERVRRDFWVGAIPGQETEGAMPAIVAGQLKRFRNVWL